MEARRFKSGRHGGGLFGKLPVVVCLSFCRRDIPDGLQQSVLVDPSHPFQGGQSHRFFGFPRCATVDQLGLIQAIDRLGQGVVVAVAFAAHRRRDAGLGQSVAVADADVLRPPCPSGESVSHSARAAWRTAPAPTRPARSPRASNC